MSPRASDFLGFFKQRRKFVLWQKNPTTQMSRALVFFSPRSSVASVSGLVLLGIPFLPELNCVALIPRRDDLFAGPGRV